MSDNTYLLRMELALAEFAREDSTVELDDDIDFEELKGDTYPHLLRPRPLTIDSGLDEEEIFDSDFMSTDEDEAQDDETSEKRIQEEEKRSRKVSSCQCYFLPSL